MLLGHLYGLMQDLEGVFRWRLPVLVWLFGFGNVCQRRGYWTKVKMFQNHSFGKKVQELQCRMF